MSQVSAVIKEMIRQQLLTLHTCLVCKVLELYSDGTAKVQPCTMMQTAKGTVKQHVALDGVPILDQIRSTVSIGKACVVVFAERDISAVRHAEFALPSASRHHSLSDGIIIGTIDGSGTAIPGGSSVPLPFETVTAKTSTNKKANGTEIQVDVKVSRQSGNKLQAKSDGLFVPESSDTNTTYNISKDGSTLKLTGSDGSESSVAIPENTNTTYRVSSGIFPSFHGVTLRGSDGSSSNAPLDTYRRSLHLPDATATGMDRATDRGYLLSTHGYAFKLPMSRYDSSHNFEMDGTYAKDDESFEFNIRGDISVNQSTSTIANLSIDCSDPDNQLSVYAYNVFEPTSEDHDYVYYYTWIAVYSKKDLSDWISSVLTSIHYTDGEYIEPSTPPDSEHSVDYVKMEEQVVKTAGEDTKYELSKTGNTITLTGTDGTSSSVTDSYMAYELLTDYFPDGPAFLLQGQKHPATTDSEITKSKLNVPYTYTAKTGSPIYRSGGDLAIDDDHYSIIDIEYGVFDDFIDSTTNVFDITIDVHFSTSIGKFHDFFLSIRITPGGSYAIVRCEDVQVAINRGVIVRKGSEYFSSRKLTAHVLRIGFGNDYKIEALGLRGVEAKLKYQTSRTGALLTSCKIQGLLVENIDAISADETVPTFFDISATDVEDVAFTGNYNDLKQKLTAGKNITIDNDELGNNTISAKDTTYDNATTSKAGLMSVTDKTNLNANTSARHTHSNKAVLDKLTDAQLTKLDGIDTDLYLPKAGGTMGGHIDMYTNKKELLVGSRSTTDNTYATPVVSGFVNAANSMVNATPSLRSYIGSYRNTSLNKDYLLISVRHRNGYQQDGGDGNAYGMMIYTELLSDGNLRWNKQKAVGSWYGARTLLDDVNFTSIMESAWTAVPTTGASATVGRSIKYLKSGNTVFVQGSISFSASLNTPVCGTMPSDCLPNQKLVFTGWDIIGAPEAFAIILDTDGKLSFLSPGTTANWFKDHRAYSFNFSYHIN